MIESTDHRKQAMKHGGEDLRRICSHLRHYSIQQIVLMGDNRSMKWPQGRFYFDFYSAN